MSAKIRGRSSSHLHGRLIEWVSKPPPPQPDRVKQSNAGCCDETQSIRTETASCQHRGGKYINITIRHHHLAHSQSPSRRSKQRSCQLTADIVWHNVQTHWRTEGCRVYIDHSGLLVSIVAAGRMHTLQKWIKLLMSPCRCIVAIKRCCGASQRGYRSFRL